MRVRVWTTGVVTIPYLPTCRKRAPNASSVQVICWVQRSVRKPSKSTSKSLANVCARAHVILRNILSKSLMPEVRNGWAGNSTFVAQKNGNPWLHKSWTIKRIINQLKPVSSVRQRWIHSTSNGWVPNWQINMSPYSADLAADVAAKKKQPEATATQADAGKKQKQPQSPAKGTPPTIPTTWNGWHRG